MDWNRDVCEFVENAFRDRDYVDVYIMYNKLGQAYPFKRVILNKNVQIWKDDQQKTMGFRSYIIASCKGLHPVWMATHDNFDFVQVEKMHILQLLYDMEMTSANNVLVKEYITGIRDYWTQKLAARKIQRHWRECNVNPKYWMCLRRLRYEFDDMVVCDVSNFYLS